MNPGVSTLQLFAHSNDSAPRARLGDLLVRKGLISEAQLTQALTESRTTGERGTPPTTTDPPSASDRSTPSTSVPTPPSTINASP